MILLRPKILCRFATNKHSLISGNDKLSALRESLRLFMHHFLLKSKKETDPVIKSRVESAENALLLSKNKNFWEINPAMNYLIVNPFLVFIYLARVNWAEFHLHKTKGWDMYSLLEWPIVAACPVALLEPQLFAPAPVQTNTSLFELNYMSLINIYTFFWICQIKTQIEPFEKIRIYSDSTNPVYVKDFFRTCNVLPFSLVLK